MKCKWFGVGIDDGSINRKKGATRIETRFHTSFIRCSIPPPSHCRQTRLPDLENALRSNWLGWHTSVWRFTKSFLHYLFSSIYFACLCLCRMDNERSWHMSKMWFLDMHCTRAPVRCSPSPHMSPTYFDGSFASFTNVGKFAWINDNAFRLPNLVHF